MRVEEQGARENRRIKKTKPKQTNKKLNLLYYWEKNKKTKSNQKGGKKENKT